MGGQTDSQVGSQVYTSRKSRKFQAYTADLRSTCVDLRWVAKRWKNLRRLAYEFEFDQSRRKWVASETQVENLRWLGSLFGQRLNMHFSAMFYFFVFHHVYTTYAIIKLCIDSINCMVSQRKHMYM